MPAPTDAPLITADPTSSHATIQCMGPFEIPPTKDDDDSGGATRPTLWLTPPEKSDMPELVRILNLSPTISQGLYSERMTFPFSAEAGHQFIERQSQSRQRRRVNHTFFLRIGSPDPSQAPVIGLVSLHTQDHGDEGLCVHNPATGQMENLCTHPLEEQEEEKESDPKEPAAQQEETETRQRARAAAEGKQVWRCGVLGYWMSDEHAGQGHMTRVVRFMLRHLGPNMYGYDRIHAEGWQDNPATLCVMAKAGMVYNATRTIHVPKFQGSKQCVEYIWDVKSNI